MSGLTGLAKAASEQKARQLAYQERDDNYVPFAKFTAGVPTQVRFLEQGDDVQWAWVHELPLEQGARVAKVTPCLDREDSPQACPGCEMGVKRKVKGWINVIIRDAPVYAKDPLTNRVLKNPRTNLPEETGQYEDRVFVWNSGPVLFGTLGQKDRAFKGLMSRDFIVVRQGSGLDTTYSIEPADVDGGPQPMTKADLALAAGKADTVKFTIPETYEVAKQLLQGVPLDAIRREEAVQTSSERNLFLEKLSKQ
jgi:hypothetical protein